MKNWERALARTLEQRWNRYRKALKRCQRKFSKGSIHATRIEARRMAAQFELLRRFASRRAVEKGQRALKGCLDTFDRLRDAQVQRGLLKDDGTRTGGVNRLRKLIVKRERRCQRKARQRIQKVKTRPVKDVAQTLAVRLREHGSNPERMRLDRRNIVRRVDAAFAGVVECRRRMDAQHPATIHRTRVAFKRFRYMMESMAPLLSGITERRLDAMKSFQALFGDFQDTVVFLARIDRFIKKGRIESGTLARFRSRLERRSQRQANQCLRRADVIFKFWPLEMAKEESG